MIVAIKLQTADGDAHNLDLQTHRLREELLLLDIDNVTMGHGARESDSTKGDPIAIGTLIMTMSNSAVLVAACQVVRTWVTRSQGRRATIKYGKDQTIELTDINTTQQQELISAFLRAVENNLENSDEKEREDHEPHGLAGLRRGRR